MLSILLLFFFISIIASLLCSLWESVLLSITPSYIQSQLNTGNKTGKLTATLKDNIDQPLAAILTLNTIAHTVGAIGVGTQASLIWKDSAPIITTVIVPIIMTAAILILSEIIPKTFGAMNWKKLTPFTTHSLNILIKVLWPLVWACWGITKLISRKKDNMKFSRSDLLALTQIGSQEGKISKLETDFIQNTLQLRQIKAKDIMTPRTMIQSANETWSIEQFYKRQDKLSFTRIPIYSSKNPDEITGFILKTDILEELHKDNHSKRLSAIKRPIMFGLNTQSVFKLFSTMINERHHICILINEHGAPDGLVSIEDIIEALLGKEIVDETDTIPDLQAHAKSTRKQRFKF